MITSRIFIFGDIHGCYDEFIELTQQVGVTDEDILVSLGDIVDRGPKSVELYHYFKNRRNSLVIIGNHERKHINNVLSYAQEIVKLQFGEEYPEFIKWLNTLGYYYDTQDALIVHAAFENSVPVEQQRQDVLAGSTSGERYLESKYPESTYWTEYYTGEKPIIYGHRVVGENPEIINNTYGIDTGACHGGMLTAIELPGFKIHQVKAKKDYWKEEQLKWQLSILQSKDWMNMDFNSIEKQFKKLDFVETPEVVEYLNVLKTKINALKNSLHVISSTIERKTNELLNQHPENFNMEVSKLPYKSFIYKCRAGNLNLEDLIKSLNTPYKVEQLVAQLN